MIALSETRACSSTGAVPLACLFLVAMAEAASPEDKDTALEEITVEANRPEWESALSPGTVSVIYPEEKKGEQKKLPDLLKDVPGIHIQEINGAGQYTVATVRGSTAAQVGVFVDGVLTKLGGDAASDLSMIPVENVVRIEVYRGYTPARFAGTWMGGVINIVTKKPANIGGSISAGASSFGGRQGSLSVNVPLWTGTFFVGVNHDESAGNFTYENYYHRSYLAYAQAKLNSATTPEQIAQWQQQLNNASAYPVERSRKNNGYENNDVLLKWQDEHWQLKASWKSNFRELPEHVGPYSGQEYVDLETYPGGARELSAREMRINQWDVLGGRRQTWGNLEWGWRLTYLEQNKHYQDPNGKSYSAYSQWSHYLSQRGGGALDGTYKWGDRHLFEFTGNYTREELYADGNAVETRPDLKYYYVQALADAQLQDTITIPWMKSLWLTPSVRWNYSSGLGSANKANNYDLEWIRAVEQLNDSKTSWQIGLKKGLGEHYTLRSSYGTFARFPNLYELVGDGAFIVPMNPSVGTPAGPEIGTQWDVGVLWQGQLLKAQANGAITYFNRHSDNLLGLYRGSLVSWSYMNLGEGQARGIELESHLGWNRWDINLSATRNQTKILTRYAFNGGTYVPNSEYGKPFGNSPEWEGTLRVDYRFLANQASAFVEFRHVDRLYDNGYWQTPLNTLGLGGKYQLTREFRFTGGVKDVFDEAPKAKLVRDVVSSNSSTFEYNIRYPLEGRKYYGSLQWDF